MVFLSSSWYACHQYYFRCVFLFPSQLMPIPFQSFLCYLVLDDCVIRVVPLIYSFLILSIFVTPHIHLTILISFVFVLASCYLCYSTHPPHHPHLIRLCPCFLLFMLLHTSTSPSSSHSSLALLLVIYVTPHIHLNILISFVFVLASCYLCYSTHPP